MQHVVNKRDLGETFRELADHRLTKHPLPSDNEITRVMSRKEIEAALARHDEAVS